MRAEIEEGYKGGKLVFYAKLIDVDGRVLFVQGPYSRKADANATCELLLSANRRYTDGC